MYDTKKQLILRILGLIISVIPPAIAVISFFPIWREGGAEVMLSGLALCLLLISAIPLFRTVKSVLRSPSAPIIWFIVFILFFALSKIADDITVIAFVGFVSNLIGAIFFNLAKKCGRIKENEKQA